MPARTTHATASKAGPCSWSSTLRSILLSAPPCLIISSDAGKIGDININRNLRHNSHPPGMIWKQTLGQCVYNDLFQEETYGSLMSRQRRRFARLESLGLSGVVFYEIPTKEAGLTLKTIFGDPSDKSVHGVTVDGLLDSVGARVVYFPSYACTSFVSGQAMSAFFQQQPRLRPVPASCGFSVDARAFINSSFTVQRSFALDLLDSCPSPLPSITLANSVPPIRVTVNPAEFIHVPTAPLPMVKTKAHMKMTSPSSRNILPIENRTEKYLFCYPPCRANPRWNKVGDAIGPHGNKLLAIRGSSTLSLISMDRSLECDTSLSKLDSTGLATDHKNILSLSDTKGCLPNKKDVRVAKRRRRNMIALSLSSIPDSGFTDKRAELAPSRRIYSTSTTSALLNPAGVLQDIGRNATQTGISVRTSSKYNGPPTRMTKGKENIAPTSMRPQRQRAPVTILRL